MQYTTEFKIQPDYVSHGEAILNKRIEWLKGNSASQMAEEIEKVVGFTEIEPLHYRMQIEAFPQQKWQAFKKQLREYIEVAEKAGLSTFNLIIIGKMLKELDQTEKINKANDNL